MFVAPWKCYGKTRNDLPCATIFVITKKKCLQESWPRVNSRSKNAFFEMLVNRATLMLRGPSLFFQIYAPTPCLGAACHNATSPLILLIQFTSKKNHKIPHCSLTTRSSSLFSRSFPALFIPFVFSEPFFPILATLIFKICPTTSNNSDFAFTLGSSFKLTSMYHRTSYLALATLPSFLDPCSLLLGNLNLELLLIINSLIAEHSLNGSQISVF